VTYVLVSLRGDKGTQDADEFARWFANRHAPFAAYHEPSPPHAIVSDAVRATQNALVFAHDGDGSIRAVRGGAPWADAPAFAGIFQGARVWVYACDTRSDALEADLASFGRLAHAAGVRVFAGHCGPVTVPFLPGLPNTMESFNQGLRGAFVAFLEGEDDVAALRDAGLAGVPLGRAAVFVSPWLEQALKTLRVLP
jgi:hypothetical protein